MALLEIENLVSLFQTPRGPIRAVDVVDLQVERGELVCLVGESGCGKSALALSILGLMPLGRAAHPQGRLLFDGRDLLAASEREWQSIRGRRIGMIFQEPMTSLNPVQKIGVQVAETLFIHNLVDKRQAAARAVQALAAVGIPEPERIAQQYPHQLSGGMRQRAMIATATIAEPDLLIADEPTTALDVTIAAQIIELLRDLQRRTRMAMLFITHDLGLVADIADRVAVMYAGQIVEAGPVKEIFSRPLHPYTKGLLASAPTGRRDQRLQTIGGSVPSPHQRPAGCRFQPRCAFATRLCEQPVASQVVGARFVRCLNHHAVATAP